jgi:hypothetical protein
MDDEPPPAPMAASTCAFPLILHSPSWSRIVAKEPVAEFTRQRSQVRYLLPQFIPGSRAGGAAPSWRAGSRKASAPLATPRHYIFKCYLQGFPPRGTAARTGHWDAASSWRVAAQWSRVRPTPSDADAMASARAAGTFDSDQPVAQAHSKPRFKGPGERYGQWPWRWKSAGLQGEAGSRFPWCRCRPRPAGIGDRPQCRPRRLQRK